ncbi:MAG: PAS domain-containing protein [Minwuia sp.]|uniref:PAS domain-containing protein n=1 Tax=Minwuia sp. TaxID=2493630 RepID=UPI003A859A34
MSGDISCRISDVGHTEFAAWLDHRELPQNSAHLFARLSHFWFSIAEGDRKPQRKDFGPQDIVFALPHLFMADVTRKGLMRYRLVGTEMARQFHRDPTTREVGASGEQWETRIMSRLVGGVSNSGVPAFAVSPSSGGDAGPSSFAAIAFPLYNEAGDINMVLGAAVFRSKARLLRDRLEAVEGYRLIA